MKRFSPIIKIGFVILFLITITYSGFAQMVPISLNDRIDRSTLVFEGKVISQKSYWDDEHHHIYTASQVQIYKIFKGESSSDKVEIITRGGKVDNKIEIVSHFLTLNDGDTGIFTAVPNTAKVKTESALPKLKAYASAQGFIQYDLEAKTAKDPFNSYRNITNDLYNVIKSKTRNNFRTVRQADFKIK